MKSRLRRALFCLLGIVTLFGIVPCVWVVVAGHREKIEKVDLVVVLGTTVHANGRVSFFLQARLDRAVELYRMGFFPRILVSGGLGKEGQQEAFAMQRYLVTQGLPIEAILVDTEGNDTFLTAAHTAALMKKQGWQSVMVISQYFHLPRCQLALKRFGIPHVVRSYARLYMIRDLYSVPREAMGLVYYWLRSYPM